jgi:hypothetical protein
MNTTRQITLDSNEYEIIVIYYKHQNGKTITSAAGNWSLSDQERRILKLLTCISSNILNVGANIILGDLQRQTNSLKDGQRHEESCLNLVFVDIVGRVQKKMLFSALKVITKQ